MPKPKKKRKRKNARGLTLAPMTFEQAVHRALSTPLPPKERRRRTSS